MARWRIAVGAGIVVALAVVAAIMVGSVMREEPEVAAEPVVAPVSPSPTATADPDPMPELHNTGEDFEQIIHSIEEFRDWLFRNPSPHLVGRIYHAECECRSALREKLELLRNDGVRFFTGAVTIREVLVLDREDSTVAVRVVDESEPATVVDDQGRVIDQSEGWDAQAYRYLMSRDSAGRWLVRDIVPMALDAEFTPEGNEA